MGEINFTITEEHLETGMRGYPVGYCTTSSVDPYKGLCYLGKEISEFRDKAPESVIYLLYYGKEGSDDQIAEFKKELVKRAHCSAKLIEQIELLPREAHPMKMFSAAILLAGVFEGTGDYREDCLNLIAKIPVITAYMINHHAGWQTVNKSQPELGYIENFCHLLNIPQSSLASVDQDNLVTVFKLFNILHYDHGGGNLSTFVGKAVASGLEDMYGSICAAMCALAGPRHGKANQDCLQFVQSLQKEVEAPLTLKKVEQVIRDKLAKKFKGISEEDFTTTFPEFRTLTDRLYGSNYG